MAEDTIKEKSKLERISLKGEAHGVVLPGFAEREELALAYHVQLKLQEGEEIRLQLFRVFSAGIGLAVPRIGRRLNDAGINYEKCGADPLVYGGKAYNWLRSQGISANEVASVGAALLADLAGSLVPTEPEVSEKANFTDPSAAK